MAKLCDVMKGFFGGLTLARPRQPRDEIRSTYRHSARRKNPNYRGRHMPAAGIDGWSEGRATDLRSICSTVHAARDTEEKRKRRPCAITKQGEDGWYGIQRMWTRQGPVKLISQRLGRECV